MVLYGTLACSSGTVIFRQFFKYRFLRYFGEAKIVVYQRNLSTYAQNVLILCFIICGGGGEVRM